MNFVKTFKGYEDKTAQLDDSVNSWIAANSIDVTAITAVLSHETDGQAGSGDLLYTVMYRADQPIA